MAYGLIGAAVAVAIGAATAEVVTIALIIQLASIGYAIGTMIGSYIDPVNKTDQGLGGAQLTELDMSTSAQGLPVPDVLGTTKLTGNCLWYGNNRSVKDDYIYKYYLTWELGLCMGPVDELIAIFKNEEIVWQGSETDGGDGYVDITIANLGTIRFYFGTGTTVADPSVAALIDDSTLNPPYKDLCYVVMDDCYIGNYNRAPTMKFIIKKRPTLAFNGSSSVGTYNYNGAHACYYVLTRMLGFSLDWMHDDDFSAAADALNAELHGGVSLLINQHMDAKDWLETILAHIEAIIIVKPDTTNPKFALKLFRADEDVGDLEEVNETDMIGDLNLERPAWPDTLNEIKLKYTRIGVQTPGTVLGQGGLCIATENTTGSGGDILARCMGIVPGTNAGMPMVLCSEPTSTEYTRGVCYDGVNVIGSYLQDWNGNANRIIKQGLFDELGTPDCSGDYIAAPGDEAGPICWDGSNLLSIDPVNNEVYKHEGFTSNILSHFTFDEVDVGSWIIRGIAWDGQHLRLLVCERDSFKATVATRLYRMDGFSNTVQDWVGLIDYGFYTGLHWYAGGLLTLAYTAGGWMLCKYTGATNTLELDSVINAAPNNPDVYDLFYKTGEWTQEDVGDEFLDFIVSEVMVYDPANQDMQARVASKSVSMNMCTDDATAMWLADRMLRRAAYPFATISFSGTRDMFRYQPGDLFKLVYPKYGITSMVCRVLAVIEEAMDEGSEGEETFNVVAAEDIDYLSSTIVHSVGPSTRKLPSHSLENKVAAKLERVGAFECPYALCGDSIQVIPLAARIKGTETGYHVYFSVDGTTYVYLESLPDYNPCGVIKSAINDDTYKIDATGFNVEFEDYDGGDVISSIGRGSLLAGNNLALIGTESGHEIISFQTITPVAGNIYTLTGILRGRYDTKRVDHVINKQFWFLGTYGQTFHSIAHEQLLTGAVRYLKYLPYNQQAVGSLSEAIAVPITIAGKVKKPYTIWNLKVNGDAYHADYTTDVVLTWSVRKRADGAGIGVADEVTDAAPSYEDYIQVRVYVSGVLKRTVSSLQALTWTYTEAMNLSDNTSLAATVVFNVRMYRTDGSITYYSADETITVLKES